MPSYSIYLPKEEDDRLAEVIASGEYDNESQAIQHAIRETYGDNDGD